MKYKGKTLTTLQTIENRLAVLENIMTYNKPMPKEDFVRTLVDIKKQVSQVIDLIDLEYDDTSKIGIN